MPFEEQIRKLLDKTTWQVFVALLGAFAFVGGLCAKFLNFNKTFAAWLQSALSVDVATHAPELRPWFVPVELACLLVVLGLLFVSVWAVKLKFAPTTDSKALDEVMRAVRQIRDQSMRLNIKTLDTVESRYLIAKDLSASVRRRFTIRATNTPLHFYEVSTEATEAADPVDSLTAINYAVKDCTVATPGQPKCNIVYLPTENQKRSKRACLFFLPAIAPGESRIVEITYQWPGLFRRMKDFAEDFEFSATTREPISRYCVEVFLQEGTRKTLDCKITGTQQGQQKLDSVSYQDGSWKGHGWVYEVTAVPAGTVNLILRAELKD